MRTGNACRLQSGVTLVELIVFIVVVTLALGGLLSVYRHSVVNSVDPLVRLRMLELAQSQLDIALTLGYDQNTPPGGVPACGSLVPSGQPSAPACIGSGGVSVLNNQVDSPFPGYTRSVTVVAAGTDLQLANDQAKRITVVVSAPNGESLTLTAYRTNF